MRGCGPGHGGDEAYEALNGRNRRLAESGKQPPQYASAATLRKTGAGNAAPAPRVPPTQAWHPTPPLHPPPSTPRRTLQHAPFLPRCQKLLMACMPAWLTGTADSPRSEMAEKGPAIQRQRRRWLGKVGGQLGARAPVRYDYGGGAGLVPCCRCGARPDPPSITIYVLCRFFLLSLPHLLPRDTECGGNPPGLFFPADYGETSRTLFFLELAPSPWSD